MKTTRTATVRLIILSLLLSICTYAQNTLTNGLVAHFQFTGNANDASGHGHNGSVSNASLIEDRFTNSNKAYNFVGDVGSLIEVADSSDFAFNDEFTVSCWVKYNEGWSFHDESILHQFELSSGYGWLFDVDQNDASYGSGNYQFHFNVGGDSVGEVVSFGTLSQWNHITCVYGNNVLTFYRNGVMVAQANGNGFTKASTSLIIGGSVNPVSGAYNRNIDDVRIYNRAILASEVQWLYEIESRGPAPISPIQTLVDQASSGATVQIPAGTYVGSVIIDKNLSLIGAGTHVTIADGGKVGRVFEIASNITVTLRDLTICNGSVIEGGHGAAIANSGDLSVISCVISNNQCEHGFGGGIYSQGQLRISDTAIATNSALRGGGIFCKSGMLTLSNCIVIDNNTFNGANANYDDNNDIVLTVPTDGGDGGGICCLADCFAVISDSLIRGNVAGNGGSNAFGRYSHASGEGGRGGGIFCYNGTVSNSIVADNSAGAAGESLSVPGFLPWPSANGGGLYFVPGYSAELIACDISNNSAGTGAFDYGNGSPGGNGGGVYCGSAILRGCTLANNHAGSGGSSYGIGGAGGDGGAVYSPDGGVLQISNCHLADNAAGSAAPAPGGGIAANGGGGGGIYCFNAVIQQCTFSNNYAGAAPPIDANTQGGMGGNGGGLDCSNAVVTESIFSQNRAGGASDVHAGTGGSAGNGGGIFASGLLQLEGCQIGGNFTCRGGFSGDGPSGNGGAGGGIFCGGTQASFTNCSFFGNYTGFGGRNCVYSPGTGGDGGGIYAVTRCSPVLEFCTFKNNYTGNGGTNICNGGASGARAGAGGAIFCSSGMISRCTFDSNRTGDGGGGYLKGGSGGDGGALYLNNATLHSCLIIANVAGGGGDSVGAGDGGPAGHGSGCWITNSIIENCTFYANQKSAGGIPSAGGATGDAGTGTAVWAVTGQVIDSVIWNNASPQVDGTPTAIEYSAVQEGAGNSWFNPATCINSDPLFRDARNGDFRLLPTSPCINNGTNEAWMISGLDLDGTPRVINGTVDMGSYEYVCPLITLGPTNFTDAIINTPYNSSISASGGYPPYAFGISRGHLPDGIALSSAGFLSGAATALGSFSFSVTATDAYGCTITSDNTLIVGCPAIILTPAVVPPAILTAPYTTSLSASNGLAPYSYNGCVGSRSYVMSVGNDPNITVQPQSHNLRAGDSLSLSVTATGTEPFSYQWEKNGAALAGATESSLHIGTVFRANAGTYAVAVYGVTSGFSDPAIVTIADPAIISQPHGGNAIPGTKYTFSIGAAGTAIPGYATGLHYQWYFQKAGAVNAIALIGKTNTTLTVGPATNTMVGAYYCVVTNRFMPGEIVVPNGNIVTSAVATLTTIYPPLIRSQPANITKVAGNDATFAVRATSSSLLTYQWMFNGVVISDATGSAYTRTNVQLADVGTYTCGVTNQLGIGTTTSPTRGQLNVLADKHAPVSLIKLTAHSPSPHPMSSCPAALSMTA